MLLYYITDRKQFAGTGSEQCRALIERIGEAASAGVDLIQLREKDLGAGALETLAREALSRVRNASQHTRLLINSRIDIALAIGADGVHLTSMDIMASDARAIWSASLRSGESRLETRNLAVGVSCHSPTEVRSAESHGADFAVLAPIFEKAGTNVPALGLHALREAALKDVPEDRRVEAGDQRVGITVLALGGVNLGNATDCLRAGASGVAGIRLFQEGEIRETVEALRAVAK
jgi:thiamine-phosphate pyrophosphorylase